MTPETISASWRVNIYAHWLPIVRKIAYEHGYALGLHGSCVKDLDVIAVPWIEDAKPTMDLVNAIALGLGLIYLDAEITQKPHRRKCFLLYAPRSNSYIDLSVVEV